MAVLADDWKENRQTCVDVLCGYLRMPYEPDPGEAAPGQKRRAFRASREVRHSVIRVITEHLKDGAAESWQGLNFDFTGVVFDGGDFGRARFSRGGMVRFTDAEFTGAVSFNEARFSGGMVYFGGAKVSGLVSFGVARFSGGIVDFHRAEFSGAALLDFSYANFDGGKTDFNGAEFSGTEVSFGNAKFSGGEVDFSRAVNLPNFLRPGSPPPGVKLPSAEDQSQA